MKSGIECAYSFNDLYKAAFGKAISKSQKAKFKKLHQAEINNLVLEWSKKACWVTQEKIGSDGKIYLSFHP